MNLSTPETRCAITNYYTLDMIAVASETIHHACSRRSSFVETIYDAVVETEEPSFVVLMLKTWSPEWFTTMAAAANRNRNV